MPPELTISRFTGLNTILGVDEGDISHLIKAQNVMFDRAGAIESRPGIRFFSRCGTDYDFSLRAITGINDALVANATHAVVDPAGLSIGQVVEIIVRSTGAVIATPLTITNIVGNNVTFSAIFTGATTQSVYSKTTRQVTYYCGDLRMNDGNVYQAFNCEPEVNPNTGGQFFWGNTVATNQSSTVTSGTPDPGGLRDTFGVSAKRYGVCKIPGAQYNQVLVFPTGQRMRIMESGPSAGKLDLDTITGFPASQDGWGSMVTHKSRIWFAPKIIGSSGTTPSRLYYSDTGTSGTWPATNSWDVGAGEEDGTITSIHSFQNRLFILKTGGMWILETPSLPVSWSLRQYSDKGCIGRCAVTHDTGVFWLGPKGVFSFDGTAFTNHGLPIQDMFDDGGAVDTADANAVLYEDKIFFQFYLKDGTHKFLCYDILLKQWTEFTTPLEAAGYKIINFFVRPKRAKYAKTFASGLQNVITEEFGPPGVFATIGDAGAKPMVYGMLEANIGSDASFLAIGPPTTYTERGMTVDFQTKFFDVEEPIQKKRVHRWEVEFSGPLTTVTQYDEMGRNKATDITGTGNTLVRVGGLGYFRKISMRFVSTSLAASRLRVNQLYAKVSIRGRQISNEQNQYV